MCKHGHPLAGENLYLRLLNDGRVKRECRICQREKGRRLAARHQRQTRFGGATQARVDALLAIGGPYLAYVFTGRIS